MEEEVVEEEVVGLMKLINLGIKPGVVSVSGASINVSSFIEDDDFDFL